MIKIIVGNDAGNQDILTKCFKFRHKIFVDEKKWEDLRRSDGLEIDQFDTNDAIHIAFLDNDNVVAYSRLLPTTKPHLLSDVYPEIVDGRINYRRKDIYEWTRCCVEKRYREYRKQTSTPYQYILCSIVKICRETGISSLIVEFHPAHISSLIELGWNVEPMMLPTEIDGETVVAVNAKLTPETLRKSLNICGIERREFEYEFDSSDIGVLENIDIAA